MIDRVQWASFRVLWRRLGLWRALRVGMALQKAERRGEPFADLPPATDEKERGSRAQAGPAILLFRALKTTGYVQALELTSEAIEAGAIAFLSQSIGPIRREELEALSPAEREAWVQDVGAKFPNAEVRWDEVSGEAVRFTVTSCRFVRLCHEVGAPELAPLFCKGDATFFGGVQKGVELVRPSTLASGGAHCDFNLQWIEEPE